MPVEVVEADMEHGKSENANPDEERDYDRWFEGAIRPGLDFVLDHLAGRTRA